MLMTLGRFTSPAYSPSRRNINLQTLFPSCVFDLDATIAASFDGSGGVWRNLTTAPADGESADAYNFNRPTSTVGFEGSAGSPAAYLYSLPSGTLRFRILNENNSDFVANLMRSDIEERTPFTAALAFRTPPLTGHVGINLLGGNLAPITANCWHIGQSTPQNRLSFIVTDDDNVSHSTTEHDALIEATDYLYVISMDAAGNWRSWLNGEMQSGTVSIPENNAPMIERLGLFRSSAAGSRFYAASMFNGYFSSADEKTLRKAYQLRHDRTYLPI